MGKGNIEDNCSHEICEINYILQGLYDERIYGINGNQSRCDGTMQTNVTKLIEYLNKMVAKLEDNDTNQKEKIFKIMKGTSNG